MKILSLALFASLTLGAQGLTEQQAAAFTQLPEIAALAAFPLSVSFAICMFWSVNSRGRRMSLYAATAAIASTTIATAAMRIQTPRFADLCPAVASAIPLPLDFPTLRSDPLPIVTRPELVSRFNLFKSARNSAAL